MTKSDIIIKKEKENDDFAPFYAQLKSGVKGINHLGLDPLKKDYNLCGLGSLYSSAITENYSTYAVRHGNGFFCILYPYDSFKTDINMHCQDFTSHDVRFLQETNLSLEIEGVRTDIQLTRRNLRDILEFIESLKLEESEDELKSIDSLYSYIDGLIDKNAFFKIDLLATALIAKEFGLRLIISFLTITHKVRKHLNTRAQLILYAKTIAEKFNLTPKQINAILKGF